MKSLSLFLLFSVFTSAHADIQTTILTSANDESKIKIGIKTTFDGEIYKFENCHLELEENKNQQDNESEVQLISCRYIGSPEGYTVQSIKNRLLFQRAEVVADKTFNVIAVSAGVLAGGTAGGLVGYGMGAKNAYREMVYIGPMKQHTFSDVMKYRKGFMRQVPLLSKPVRKFTITGFLLGGTVGGPLAHGIYNEFVDVDTAQNLETLSTATSPNQSSLTFVELELDDMYLAISELNRILAGIPS